jgi:hypothetical protein
VQRRRSSKELPRAELQVQLGDKDGNGWANIEPFNRCEIMALLTTEAEVELYADAGDLVVTNPSRTVGVKTHSDPVSKRACVPYFTKALADL